MRLMNNGWTIKIFISICLGLEINIIDIILLISQEYIREYVEGIHRGIHEGIHKVKVTFYTYFNITSYLYNKNVI